MISIINIYKKIKNRFELNKKIKYKLGDSSQAVILTIIFVLLLVSSFFTLLVLNNIYVQNIQFYKKQTMGYFSDNINLNINKWLLANANELHILKDNFILNQYLIQKNSGETDTKLEQEINRTLANIINKYSLDSLSSIAIANKDGTIVISSNKYMQNMNISTFSFYRKIKEGYTYVASKPFFLDSIDEYIYLMAIPVITDDGIYLGQVLAYYKWNDFINKALLGSSKISSDLTFDLIDAYSGISIVPEKNKNTIADVKVEWSKNLSFGQSDNFVYQDPKNGKKIYINYQSLSQEYNYNSPFDNYIIFPQWYIVIKSSANVVNEFATNSTFLKYAIAVIFIYILILLFVCYLIFYSFIGNIIGDNLLNLHKSLTLFLDKKFKYYSDIEQRKSGVLKLICGLSNNLNKFSIYLKSEIISLDNYKKLRLTKTKDLSNANLFNSKNISKTLWYYEQNINLTEQTKESLDLILRLNRSLSNLVNNGNDLINQLKHSKELSNALSATKSQFEQLDLEFNEIKINNIKNKDTLDRVIGYVKEISQQSADLQNTNQTIQSIASQTNILAVNAAIEANHAGIAGKGFAVISEEIKNLSEEASSQALSTSNNLMKIKGDIYTLSKESELVQKGLTYFNNVLDSYGKNRDIYKTSIYDKTTSLEKSLDYLGALEQVLEENKEFVSQMSKTQNFFNSNFGNVVEIRENFASYINQVNSSSKTMQKLIDELASYNSEEQYIVEQMKKRLDDLFKDENSEVEDTKVL